MRLTAVAVFSSSTRPGTRGPSSSRLHLIGRRRHAPPSLPRTSSPAQPERWQRTKAVRQLRSFRVQRDPSSCSTPNRHPYADTGESGNGANVEENILLSESGAGRRRAPGRRTPDDPWRHRWRFRRLRAIMVPRTDIAALDVETVRRRAEVIVEDGYSRVPVFDETIDNVTGIAYAKDLLNAASAKAATHPCGTIGPPAVLRARNRRTRTKCWRR